MAPGTGFLLNNEMDDFAVRPGAANAIAPAKRPLSSMTAIVEKDGRAVFVIGSPGGPRIITAVLETLMNLVDFGVDPNAAVAASRFHQQYLPDTVFYETAGLPVATVSARGARRLQPQGAGAVGRGRADRGHARRHLLVLEAAPYQSRDGVQAGPRVR